MLLKNQIKFVQSLKQKKNREQEGLFIAEGEKIVAELIDSGIKIKQLYALDSFFQIHNIDNSAIECVEITPKELEQISLLTTPNKALAVCYTPTYSLNDTTFENKLTIVLDGIRDPGNMGTIMRIADWFGIANIICSNDTVEVFNPKVVQATMGSIARINVFYTELEPFFNSDKASEIPRFGAVLQGENIYKKQLPSSGFIVIGNEAKGISENVMPFINHKITIPNFSHFTLSGAEAESLNAAVATAIICSEFRRNTEQ
jgi:RNA methyltransferase, TrmH family